MTYCEGHPYCKKCGSKTYGRFRRKCQMGEASPQTNRQRTRQLGDLIEDTLSTIGITPERWVYFKGKFGLPKVCNCGDRKKWLNQFSKEFGDAAAKVIGKLKP